MQKKIFAWAALLMASATFTACSSDDDVAEQPQPATTGTYTMTIEATKDGASRDQSRACSGFGEAQPVLDEVKGGEATTRALSLDGKTLNATWATTEHIYVQKGSSWAGGSLQPQTNGATATLKGTLSDITINADDVLTLQFPRSGARDYTGQVGTLADIAEKYDYATATVEVESVSPTGNINPKAATTTFTNQQAIVKFTLIDKADGATPLSATRLVVSDGTNSYTVTPASGTSEIYVALPGFSEQTVSLAATVGSDTYFYEKSGVTFANGQYYEITVKMKLLGKFSVSSTQQVYFSPGNLQAVFAEANTSSCTWQFAPTQYSYIGNATANTVVGDNQVTTAGTVDLFGWVGANSSLPAFGINNDDDNDNYGKTDVESIKGDWGLAANAAKLGGHEDWRTLTTDECDYLIATRTNASQKYGHGVVNSVKGMIILPDDWTLPSGLSFTAGLSSWKNSYSTTNWEKMEANGAVFLPAAGYRIGTTMSFVNERGYYWSSSNSGPYYAYVISFYSSKLNKQGMNQRRFGQSVRLVRDVQ